MCRAHLTGCLNITHGADIRTHCGQAGTAGSATFPVARIPGRQRRGRSVGAGLAGGRHTLPGPGVLVPVAQHTHRAQAQPHKKIAQKGAARPAHPDAGDTPSGGHAQADRHGEAVPRLPDQEGLSRPLQPHDAHTPARQLPNLLHRRRQPHDRLHQDQEIPLAGGRA